MLVRRFVVWTFSVGVMVLASGGVSGQDYPNKPIRIVTGAVGSGNDFISRLIAPGISVLLGQPVVIENRGNVISAENVSKAPPDGYTLLVHGTPFYTTPLLQKTSYDPVRDFSPISLVTKEHSILVVHPSVPVKSVKELIALAKARPAELNYGSGGTGGTSHLGMELFKAMAGVNIVRISYKSDSVQTTDLVSGELQLMLGGLNQVMQYVKLGKLTALAVTSAELSPLLPGLPTVAATLPGFEVVSRSAMYAPAKTPTAIITRLNQEVVRFVKQPDMKQKFSDARVEVVGSSPEELAATMKSEMARLGKLIKDIGIKVD